MKSPNEQAQKALAIASTEFKKIAAVHEVIADLTNAFAIALERGDTESIVRLRDEISKIQISRDAGEKAIDLAGSADPEWMKVAEETLIERQIGPLSKNELLSALHYHKRHCNVGDDCRVEELIKNKLKKFL